jgi:uncharacterized membrane protein affecting hemolysin expression
MSRSKWVSSLLADIWHRILALPLIGDNKRWWICLFSAWLMLLVLICLIIGDKVGQLKRDINQSGISLAKLFASQASLPLLERDMEALSATLKDTTSRPDVLYAAIIDHQNNIIAYTNPELIMPVNKGSLARTIDGVSFWKGLSADQAGIISFSTNVTYSKVKIGEVYLALSAAELGNWKGNMGLIVIASFAMLLLVGVVFHFQGRRPNFRDRQHSSPQVPMPDTASMQCPLCGSEKLFSEHAVSHANIDKLMFLQPKDDRPSDKCASQSEGISFLEIAERKELKWLKRQVIFRCTEIIKKLAT